MSGLEVQNLRKSYGEHEVLRGLSFRAAPGELLGFLGVNGAGKTTTISCICGILRPDGGSIGIDGRLGVQLQSSALPGAMRAGEAMELFGRAEGLSDNEIRSISAQMQVDQFWDTQYAQLSTGQERALQIAAALLRRPQVLVLDEPTAGLDAEGRIALTGVLERLRDDGCAILMASHNLLEVEDLADHAIILKDGVCAWSGVPGQIRRNASGECEVILRTAHGEASYWTSSLAETLRDKLTEYIEAGTDVLEVQTRHDSLLDTFLQVEEEAV